MANISFILDNFPAGGTERVTMNLARPLADLGHRIFIFVHHLDEDNLPDKQLPVHYIHLPYKSSHEKNYPIIEQAIKEYGIDVFFSPARFPDYLLKLHQTALCQIVYVLHSCPFFETIAKWNQITGPQKNIGKWLIAHLITLPKYWMGYYKRKSQRQYQAIYDHSAAFGVLFDAYGEQIARALDLEYSTSKLVTLKNPIPASDYDEQTASPREKMLLYVGRLDYGDKRVDRLLAVWRKVYERFPEWRLSIVGSGAEERRMRNYVKKYGLQRVEFLGYSAHPETYYEKAEILLLTSDFEGCPMVLLEAQGYGAATIAFDCCGGVREILSPNWENGVYIPNGDIDAYADALARLMTNNSLRKTIQKNGLENVKRFSVAESVQMYHHLIQKLTHR